MTLLYVSQCASANLLNRFNCPSSVVLASDNCLHVSKDFWGSDFCQFFTAPTIDGVDDPPVPGSPSNYKYTTGSLVLPKFQEGWLKIILARSHRECKHEITQPFTKFINGGNENLVLSWSHLPFKTSPTTSSSGKNLLAFCNSQRSSKKYTEFQKPEDNMFFL